MLNRTFQTPRIVRTSVHYFSLPSWPIPLLNRFMVRQAYKTALPWLVSICNLRFHQNLLTGTVNMFKKSRPMKSIHTNTGTAAHRMFHQRELNIWCGNELPLFRKKKLSTDKEQFRLIAFKFIRHLLHDQDSVIQQTSRTVWPRIVEFCNGRDVTKGYIGTQNIHFCLNYHSQFW